VCVCVRARAYVCGPLWVVPACTHATLCVRVCVCVCVGSWVVPACAHATLCLCVRARVWVRLCTRALAHCMRECTCVSVGKHEREHAHGQSHMRVCVWACLQCTMYPPVKPAGSSPSGNRPQPASPSSASHYNSTSTAHYASTGASSRPNVSQAGAHRRNQVSAPRRNQVSAPRRNQVSAQRRNQVSAPRRNQVSAPRRNQVSAPRRNQVSAQRRERCAVQPSACSHPQRSMKRKEKEIAYWRKDKTRVQLPELSAHRRRRRWRRCHCTQKPWPVFLCLPSQPQYQGGGYNYQSHQYSGYAQGGQGGYSTQYSTLAVSAVCMHVRGAMCVFGVGGTGCPCTCRPAPLLLPMVLAFQLCYAS